MLFYNFSKFLIYFCFTYNRETALQDLLRKNNNLKIFSLNFEITAKSIYYTVMKFYYCFKQFNIEMLLVSTILKQRNIKLCFSLNYLQTF